MTNSKISLVFMGTPEFACPSLENIVKHPRFEVLAVITQPDKKIGRKQEIIYSPVKKLALNHNLTILQPETLKGNVQLLELLKGLKPDFIVVVAYGQILDQNILNLPKYGCINIHGSLLPKYRGASPVEQAILNNDSETGITIMEMDSKMDHGRIYLLKKTEIEENDNALTLREKLSKMGATFLPEVLIDIVDNDFSAIEQNHTQATYCKKISKEDSLIDLNIQSAQQIKQIIKAYTPWPGCYIEIKNKKLKLIKINIESETNKHKKLKAGECDLTENQLRIGTVQGIILPLEVQLEGKKALPIQEFLRGNRQLFQEK